MPLRHKSAQKRARQTVKRTDSNKRVKALIKGSTKRVVAAKDKTAGIEELKKTVAILDRAAVKGVIHKNKAARHKSRLNAKIKALA